MRKEYQIKEQVWIHNGETSLVEGRVVEVFDLEHLNEGLSGEDELYVIEIQTGIEPIYEVRSWQQISPDSKGPINLFRNQEIRRANRYFRKVGIQLPETATAESVIDLLPKEKPKRKYYRSSKK